MNDTPKKGLGCGTVALAAVVVMIALIAGLSMLTVRVLKPTRAERVKVATRETSRSEDGRVILRQDELADYATYQTGAPLERDVFIAWQIDPRRTTLSKDVFTEKVEGAEVNWKLMADDITRNQNHIIGDFRIPCSILLPNGAGEQYQEVHVRCEFAEESRDALLSVRRGDWVGIRGRLSLKNGRTSILEARLHGRQAEQH